MTTDEQEDALFARAFKDIFLPDDEYSFLSVLEGTDACKIIKRGRPADQTVIIESVSSRDQSEP